MTDETLRTSPFAPLIGSFPVPADLSLADVRHFLEKPLVELKGLDEEVEQLHRRMQSLVERCNKLIEVVERHQQICHPIRRVPHEILQEIFLHCVDPPPLWPTLDIDDAPLCLTRVSHDWRFVAFNTPQLWDRLVIIIPGGTEAFIRRCMDKVRRWFGAAGTRPLTISLRDKGYGTSDEGYKIVQETILEYAGRIKSLDLHIPDAMAIGLSNTLPASSWTVLESVKITDWEEGELSAPSLMLWAAPRVKSVQWDALDGDLWGIPVQWCQIEDIRVVWKRATEDSEVASASEARTVLQAAPKLCTLHIQLSGDPAPRPLSDFPGGSKLVLKTPLILTYLTRLHLIDTHLNPASHPVIFLDDLQLPALVTLSYTLFASNTITEDSDSEEWYAPLPSDDAHPLVRFLRNQRSPILIRSFKIHTASIKGKGLVECLKMMPLLERFWLEDPDALGFISWMTEESGTNLDGSFLTQLSPTESIDGGRSDSHDRAETCLCPRLVSLRLDCINCELEDVEDFVVRKSESTIRRLARNTHASLAPFAPLQRISLGIVPTRNLDPEETRTELKEKFADMNITADIKVLAIQGPEGEAPLGLRSTHYDPHGGQTNYLWERQSAWFTLHDPVWA